MFKTHEVRIGLVLRLLTGALGAILVIIAPVLLVHEVSLAMQGEWLRIFTAGFMLIVLVGGLILVRGAIRGRLSVRSYPRKK